jgi:hypothetical protein
MAQQNGAVFQTAPGSNVSTIIICWELHEMDEAAAHKPKITMAMPSISWSGVKLAAIGLWSSGSVFSGVMNHASPSGSPID